MKRTASEPGLSPTNKMQFTDRKKFVTDPILLLQYVRPFTDCMPSLNPYGPYGS